MADQIITKRCSRCKEIKPLSEFYKSKKEKDGFHYYCKICCSNYVRSEHAKQIRREYSKTYKHAEPHIRAQHKWKKSKKGKLCNKKYQQNFYQRKPLKKRARCAIAYAVHTGKILAASAQKCRNCNNQAEQYHHTNGYAKAHWFDIIPLCYSCHHAIHINDQ